MEDEISTRALPGSGTITLNQIGEEYRDTNPKSVSEYRDRLWIQKPNLRGTPTSFSNFYGIHNVAVIDIYGTVNNYNMQSGLGALVNSQIVQFNWKSGGRFGSTSTSIPAVRTGGTCGAPNAVIYMNIEGNAFIVGKGGNGGNSSSSGNGAGGGTGGDAIRIESGGRTFRINNSGIIAGGGGGGGGGGGVYKCTRATKSGACTNSVNYYGGGGLGGSGQSNGANGAGSRGAGHGAYGGVSGGGGGWGAPGGRGGNASGGTTNWAGGGGGAAGFAIRKVAGITAYDRVGDIRGVRQ